MENNKEQWVSCIRLRALEYKFKGRKSWELQLGINQNQVMGDSDNLILLLLWSHSSLSQLRSFCGGMEIRQDK